MNQREVKLTLDLLSGTDAKVIAEREGITVSRVYYISGKIKDKVALSMDLHKNNVTAEHVGLWVQRRLRLRVFGWSPDTPEGFAYNLERERLGQI